MIQQDEFIRAKRVSVYLSTPKEVDTVAILRKMFELGKTVFVPRLASYARWLKADFEFIFYFSILCLSVN